MNKGRERLITMLLLAGMTATFVAAVNLPGRRADAAMREEIARAEAEIARESQAHARLCSEQAKLDNGLRYLSDSAAVVAPTDPHELLGRISRLAAASSLTVKRLEPETVRPRASYSERPFRLEFRGDFASLGRFLAGLESGPRLFAVEHLTIRKAADGAKREALEGSLRFSVYAESGGASGIVEESGSAALR